jgi:hypothetical protein
MGGAGSRAKVYRTREPFARSDAAAKVDEDNQTSEYASSEVAVG